MFGDDPFDLRFSFPQQHSRLRFVADHERHVSLDGVLFDAVDLHRRMIRSRSEIVSSLKIAGVL
jgi:hypothetical protein